MLIRKLKGFKDVLPDETPAWQKLEAHAREVFAAYGFEEVRLPIMEQTGLFLRSIGEVTDIVEKEMYSFTDAGDENITLRPEGTASAVRAYIESPSTNQNPKARWYYMGPMFRRERPQKGRFRQFNQFGAECFGWAGPGADADVISMLWKLFAALGLGSRVSLEINSLGCGDDRKKYADLIVEYASSRVDELCDNCKRRMHKNPFRLLDCKAEGCKKAMEQAPFPSQTLCGECADHFKDVRKFLDLNGVLYNINPRMVRGLDYYNRTTFELLTGELGAQNAVAAGGRYDGLVEELGGPKVPALGFALGVERLILMLGEEFAKPQKPRAYFVYANAAAFDMALGVRKLLIEKGVRADIDFEQRSFKAQFKGADASGADFAVVIHEDELKNNMVTVKDLKEGGQQTLEIADAVKLIAGR